MSSFISSQELPLTSVSIAPAEEQKFFRENGYTYPFSLANSQNVEMLSQAIQQFQKSGKGIKYSVLSPPYGDRKAHIFSKIVFDLATDTAILDALTRCLGADILLWIGHVITRKPKSKGQFWHIDQINWEVDGVHASIAITDMTLENGCLQVIPKTHQYNLSQSELEAEAKLAGTDLWDGEAMVALANRLHPENAPHELVSLEVKAGQSFLTKGGLWHGVPRSTANRPRAAVVARYMRPNIAGKEAGRPLPCVLVAGADTEQKNNLCHPPQPWFKGNVLLNYRLNKLLGKVANLMR
ncbi:MAG: phytanoyl-CoA dioxygenase family protein [Cyanobacteria bacterium P01_D01_bin.56]